MPKRKNKAREAPKISKILSGLIENAFGFGGLKLGGGENVVVFGGSSLEVTGVSVEDDLMLNEFLLMGRLVLALKIGRYMSDGEKFKAPAIIFRREYNI